MSQAATALSVHRSRVHQMIRAGILRSASLVRGGKVYILREWLLDALKAGERRPTETGGAA